MAEDSSFLVFTVVDSETDEWPLDHMRERCSDRMLEKADAEKQEYLDQVGPTIMAACREIIEKLG